MKVTESSFVDNEDDGEQAAEPNGAVVAAVIQPMKYLSLDFISRGPSY